MFRPIDVIHTNAEIKIILIGCTSIVEHTGIKVEIIIFKTVTVKNISVDLTRKEYDLLLYLATNKNRVVSKNAIAENLSGDGADLFDNFDFIYAHMKNLKKKLIAAGCDDYIKSVYGMGYKFSVQ